MFFSHIIASCTVLPGVVCCCLSMHSAISGNKNLHCAAQLCARTNTIQILSVRQKKMGVCAHLVGTKTDWLIESLRVRLQSDYVHLSPQWQVVQYLGYAIIITGLFFNFSTFENSVCCLYCNLLYFSPKYDELRLYCNLSYFGEKYFGRKSTKCQVLRKRRHWVTPVLPYGIWKNLDLAFEKNPYARRIFYFWS